MSKTTDDIVIGANGSVYIGDVGATPPTDASDPWGGDWLDLGYTDENGIKLTDSKTLADIPVWQLFYPARKIITARDFNVDFVLRQFDGPTVTLAFGGGEVTEDSPGNYRYTPPDPEFIDERALGLEWLDGDKVFRLLISRGLVGNNVASDITRSKAADLPITFGIIGEAGSPPYEILTTDESFASLVGS